MTRQVDRPAVLFETMAKNKKQRSSGQERAQAEARRVARQRERKRRVIAVVAALLVLAFLASTVGALVVGSTN